MVIEHEGSVGMDGRYLSVHVARSFFQRLTGLLFKPKLQSHEALLILACNSVHMMGMRYSIDVAYLDNHGTIVKCVSRLRPFSISICRGAYAALELAPGAIERLDLRPGDRIPFDRILASTCHTPAEIMIGPVARSDVTDTGRSHARMPSSPCIEMSSRAGVLRKKTGAATAEFVVVAPVLMLMGLGILQYGLLFFAKNNINYATFEAARAGAMASANINTVLAAYKKALIPLYGGGRNATELAESYARVKQDMTDDTLKVELLNPTTEGFEDWNAKGMQDDPNVGNGKRVIPALMQNFPQALNSYQLTKDPKSIGTASGQNLADASLIKVRVIHGYKSPIPVIGKMMAYLGGYNETDDFKKKLYDNGRIPIVSHVTMQMQSNAIESTNISSPGMGNNGSPVDPGPAEEEPFNPSCSGTFCSAETSPVCDSTNDPNCNSSLPDDLCASLLRR